MTFLIQSTAQFQYDHFQTFFVPRCRLINKDSETERLMTLVSYFENWMKNYFAHYDYRGFLHYATFGTWKKNALAKNRISKILSYVRSNKIDSP